MKTMQSVEELNKLILTELRTQSQLPNDKILNALSLRGNYLDTLRSNEEYDSIDVDELLVLFELRTRQNDEDVSFDEDTKIAYDRSFSIYVIIYGDNSSDLATKLVARFYSERVRNELYAKGVYVQHISQPTVLNEYKNDTMWIRNDFQIDISCEFKIDKIYQDELSDTINKTTIMEVTHV